LPTRTLNVLLTGDATKMQAAFASAVKGSTLAKAGIAGAAAATAVAVGKALYDIGSEFDQVSDQLRTSTGKTGKQLESLEESFKNVIQNVPASFEEVGEAMGDVEKRLGLMHKPLEARTKQFVELSRITDSDLTGNIKAVARAFEDAEIPLGKQGEKLDELFRASQKSGASVEELATLMAKFGSPLRQFGIGFDESLAMFAEFEKTGVNIQTMVPGLKIALKTFLEEGKDPAKSLKETFKGLEEGTIGTSEALKIFGGRAGADMIEAVDQGRFHLEGFEKQIVKGKDTINKAGESTKDASERFEELGNKLKVLVAPAAEFVFQKLGDLAGALAHFNLKAFAHDLGLTNRDLKTIGEAMHNVGAVLSSYLGPIVKNVLGGIKTSFQGFLQVVRGIVKTISALLTGQWGKAWDGVKEIFSGGIKAVLGMVRAVTAPLRRDAELVGKGLVHAFGSAWGTVKGIFSDGVSAVTGFIQDILDVINVLPGVDIHITGSSGPDKAAAAKGTSRHGGETAGLGKTQNRYSGGPITRPMAIVGEEAPQHHEWVIATNPKYRKNNVAYWAQAGHDLGIPGFGSGGLFGTGVGPDFSIGEAAELTPPGLLYKAGKAAFGTAQDVIGALPTPHLPNWMGNLGGWIIDKVSDWVKDQAGSFFSLGGGGGPSGGTKGPKGVGTYKGVPMANWVIESLEYAARKGVSPQPTSGYRSHEQNVAEGRNYFSEHEKTQYPGGAVDFGGYNTGLAAKMAVVEATRDFKYPLLAPIGFHDDGHASGTGHYKGGLLGRFAAGGLLGTVGPILMRNGLNAIGAAGIMGNAWQESGWRTDAIEPGTHNGGLWGFTAPPVDLASVEAYAASRGLPWTSAVAQTQFMLHHLSSSVKSMINNASSPGEAAELFMNNWEHPNPAYANTPNRVAGALKAYGFLKRLEKGGAGALGGGRSGQGVSKGQYEGGKYGKGKTGAGGGTSAGFAPKSEIQKALGVGAKHAANPVLATNFAKSVVPEWGKELPLFQREELEGRATTFPERETILGIAESNADFYAGVSERDLAAAKAAYEKNPNAQTWGILEATASVVQEKRAAQEIAARARKGFEEGNIRQVTKRIKKINQLLRTAKGRLTAKQAKKLQEERAELVATRATDRTDAQGAGERLAGFQETTASEKEELEREGPFGRLVGGFDSAVENIESIVAKALEESDAQRERKEQEEERVQVEKEHTEALKAVADELKGQRQLGESIMATSASTYLRVIADINAGMIGAKSNHTAQLAGSGSLGTA